MLLAGLLLVPQPALAGARTALGVAAGAVLGAAVLGAMARGHATPQPGAGSKSSAPRKSSKKNPAPKQDGGTASAANDDPFASPAGEARPVSSRP